MSSSDSKIQGHLKVMAASTRLQTFTAILDDLRIVAEAHQALHKGNITHTDLQGVIERDSVRLKFHYEGYLNDTMLPVADRIRLEKLCDLLRDIHKAQRNVMAIIIRDLKHGHPENPPLNPAQQTLVKLWQTMQSEKIESPRMHTLIIEALLPHRPAAATAADSEHVNLTAEPTVHKDEAEAPEASRSWSTTSETQTQPDVPVTRSSSKRAGSPTWTSVDPSNAKVPKALETGFFKAESIIRPDRVAISGSRPFIINIIFDAISREWILAQSGLEGDPEEDIISGMKINAKDIKSPICYSRSQRAIRLTHHGQTFDLLMLTASEGESLLQRLKELCPSIGHSNVGNDLEREMLYKKSVFGC
ncbi:MAG: hypothetical protein Q9184_005062 [Pyrenodesmia sp. 2 TL-2023]